MENILLFHRVLESGNYLECLLSTRYSDVELSILSLDLCFSDTETVPLIGFELRFLVLKLKA